MCSIRKLVYIKSSLHDSLSCTLFFKTMLVRIDCCIFNYLTYLTRSWPSSSALPFYHTFRSIVLWSSSYFVSAYDLLYAHRLDHLGLFRKVLFSLTKSNTLLCLFGYPSIFHQHHIFRVSRVVSAFLFSDSVFMYHFHAMLYFIRTF